MNKISVIGAGAWGTTASILLSKKNDVKLWVKGDEKIGNERLCEIMKKERVNRKFLPDFKIPEGIIITDSLEDAVQSEIIITAVPSQHLREIADKLKKYLPSNAIIVSLTKGIEYDWKKKRILRASEILKSVLEIDEKKIAIVSGPNIATEIAKGFPSATVVASKNYETAEKARKIFNMPPILRAYRNDDVVGVELGGALKNPYAIGAGVCGFLMEKGMIGKNSKAAYKTRSLQEMIKIGTLLGGKEKTFYGLSGLGDLDVTCESENSRNFLLGYHLAQGIPLETITNNILKDKVIEGVNTAKYIYKYCEHLNIDTNIMKQIYLLLYEKKQVKEAINDLMSRNTEVE